MKKYACNRLYLYNRFFNLAWVVIDAEGRVQGFESFTEEKPGTEWLGGVIVLSDKETAVPTRNFKEFLSLMTASRQEVYAWHLSDFDFQKEELTSRSIIRRL